MFTSFNYYVIIANVEVTIQKCKKHYGIVRDFGMCDNEVQYFLQTLGSFLETE